MIILRLSKGSSRVSSLTRRKTTIRREATWIVGLLSVVVFSLVSSVREEGLVEAILGERSR